MIHIKRKKLADSVIEDIQRRIENGQLKEGDKLPNQHELAAQLGVSRTVLREALQMLTILGIVEQRPKSGTVIRASAPTFYIDKLIPPFMFNAGTISELIEARRFIEVGAAELAAERATDEDIRQMDELVKDMVELIEQGDIDVYTEKNVAFHFLIAKASQNRFLPHALATIRRFMEQWMLESVRVMPGLLERSIKSHRAIYQAIRDRNARKAMLSMKKHISDLRVSFDQYYHVVRKNMKGRQL